MTQATIGTPPHTGPTLAILPRSDDAAPIFAGFAFTGGEHPPHEPGVFILTRRLADRLYPVVVGEAENIAAAMIDLRANDPAAADATDGVFWLPRAQPRQRAHIARDLARKYNPPLEAEHRTAAAAAEIAELVPDRAAASFPPAPAEDGAEGEERALHNLVESFYRAGQRDPLLGPIFSTAIGDWDRHISLIADFWSKALTGTARYQGFPYTAHIGLALTPEHFERWVRLFAEAAERELPPAAAARAIAKASSMSRCFQAGLCPVEGPSG